MLSTFSLQAQTPQTSSLLVDFYSSPLTTRATLTLPHDSSTIPTFSKSPFQSCASSSKRSMRRTLTILWPVTPSSTCSSTLILSSSTIRVRNPTRKHNPNREMRGAINSIGTFFVLVLMRNGVEMLNDIHYSLIRPLLKAFVKIPNSISPNLPITAPMTHLIHCLLSIPVEGNESEWFHGRRSPSPPSTSITSRARSLLSYRPSISSSSSSSRQSSPRTSESGSESHHGSSSDIVQRTYDLVSKCLEHYFPGKGDVDARDVRTKAQQEGVNLDELLPPSILLLRKMAGENANARRRLKNWILPEDLYVVHSTFVSLPFDI